MRIYFNMQDVERKRGFYNQARYWLNEAKKVTNSKIFLDEIAAEIPKIADEELARAAAKRAY